MPSRRRRCKQEQFPSFARKDHSTGSVQFQTALFATFAHIAIQPVSAQLASGQSVQSRFRNALARSASGNSFSSARNSGPCTQRRLPRSLTGCFKWSIS